MPQTTTFKQNFSCFSERHIFKTKGGTENKILNKKSQTEIMLKLQSNNLCIDVKFQ